VNIPQLFPKGTNLDDRLPAISLGQLGTDYTLNWVPWTNKADDYQIRDDFSWTKGNHQFKFGASWALYKKIQTYFADTEGQFGFSGNYTGNDFADYLLGMASSYSEDGYQGKGHWDNQVDCYLCAGQLEGQQEADCEPRPSLGWHSAHLRGIQQPVELLSEPV
jgi:hypothetical protein